MTKREKRTFTKRDVGKVFRWKSEPDSWCYFWPGPATETRAVENGMLLLVHSPKGDNSRWAKAYLFIPHRKIKWVLGELHKYSGPGYYEELTPLEVLLFCGAKLPRKYKRKQFK